MVPLLFPPTTLQVTAVFVVPLTVALKVCVPFTCTVAVAGVNCTEIPVIVTIAEPDFVGSACDAAVTVTCDGFGAVAGAAYNPVAEIVPFAAPPPTLQVTAVFEVPDTVAVNCCVPAGTTVAVAGETVTEIGVGGVELPPPPPHPATITSTTQGKTQGYVEPMEASSFYFDWSGAVD
jgi:hypothetical protein